MLCFTPTPSGCARTRRTVQHAHTHLLHQCARNNNAQVCLPAIWALSFLLVTYRLGVLPAESAAALKLLDKVCPGVLGCVCWWCVCVLLGGGVVARVGVSVCQPMQQRMCVCVPQGVWMGAATLQRGVGAELAPGVTCC